MFSKIEIILVLWVFGLFNVSLQLSIDTLPTSATVKQYESSNICVNKITVTDSDNSTGYTCIINPANNKFTAQRDSLPDDRYCVVYLADQGPLTTTEIVTFSCTNIIPETEAGDLTINVKLNEAPQVSPIVSTSVDATAAVLDASFFNLPVTDNDGDSLVYTLVSPSDHFYIGIGDGTVKPSKDLRSLTASSVTLDITVADPYNPPVPFKLNIAITNLNTLPTVTNAPVSPIKVLESETGGYIIYTCTKADSTPAANDPPLTTAVFNPPTTDLEFDSAACEIKISAGGQLKDEVQKTYIATITVDDGFLSQSYDITIQVEHVNSTIIITNLPGQGTVLEKENADKCVLPLEISDTGGAGYICDLNSPHAQFSVTKRAGDTEFCVYYIFTQGTPLDQSSYPLTVKCTNVEGIETSSEARIDVKLNGPPSVAATLGEVVDVATSNPGSPVYTIPANDTDGDPIIFTVKSQSPASAGFTVGADDGTIRSSQDLRFSDIPTVTMEVEVSDGVLTSTTMVTLTMTNLNIAPEITNLDAVNVPENTDKGSEIYKCNVQDDTVYDVLTYTAVFDPPNNALVFNPTNCAVKISDTTKLDFEAQESYKLTINVNDGFKQKAFDVNINVINENDPPTFTIKSYSENIKEGSANSIVVTPVYKYTDPETNPVTFEIVNTGPVQFQISDPTTGVITNVDEIDFENLAANPIPVTVKVKDATSGDDTAIVYLTVTDSNDNTPVFDKALYEFDISLSTPTSTKLTVVKATDLDSTTNAEITYRLKNTSPFFKVLPSGDVVLEKPINVPYSSILTAEIEAVDNGSPQRIGTTIISGIWNEAPTIQLLPEYKTIAADQTETLDMFTFKTTDPENNPVTCKINRTEPATTPGLKNTDGAFIVVKQSGTEDFIIKFAGNFVFDVSDQADFDIYVLCEDGNGGTDINFLNVRVTPNKQPEAACSPTDSKSISALNNTINTQLYTVDVTDQENNALLIKFNSTPNNGFYRYDQSTKTIQVLKDLREETTASYTWTLEINDDKHASDPSVTCVIEITVTDLNVAPIFKKIDRTISLPEDTLTNTVVHTFDVTDDDNTELTCEVTPNSEANVFAIDATANTISLAPGKEFDFESPIKLYTFLCEATDTYKTTTATLTMSITDTNDRPKFDKLLYTETVDEGLANTIVIRSNFSFTDEEMSGGQQTYAYSLPSNVSAFWQINPVTGVIQNVQEIDVDAAGAATTMQLMVQITDSEGGVGTATLDINLRDINDHAPEFNPNIYQYVLNETLDVGKVLGTVMATDNDKDQINKKIVYSLDQPSEFFEVTPDGKLTVIKSLVGQYDQTYDIKVKATDTGINPEPKSTTASVIFTWNEKPEITNLDTPLSIKEDQGAPMDVKDSAITTTDPENNPVKCSIISINPNTDVFDVKDAKIHYNFKRPLVYKEVQSYRADLECRDTVGGGRVVKQIQIDIEKNHDPVPDCLDLEKATANVDVESDTVHEAGKVVHSITTDDEEDDAITYSMVNAGEPFAVGRFDGKITTTMDLRLFQTQPDKLNRELVIQVEDAKENQVTCTVIVKMTNLNEPPKFVGLPKTIDVEESTDPEANDREIASITIEDSLTCSTPIGFNWNVLPAADKDLFTVALTGTAVKISVAKGQELDHEKNVNNNEYKFTLTANDGCLLESSEVLTVNVKDVNEPPIFRKGDKYAMNISEVESGVIDLGCDGYDPDDNDELTLELSGTNADKFKVIDHAKCIVQLIGEFPIDKPDSAAEKFTFDMTLKDKAGIEETKATVSVNIWDYNDNAPEFEQPAYQGNDIFSGDTAGKELGKVAATDDDIRDKTNGAVEYYLQSCNNGGEQLVSVLGDGTVKLKQSPARLGLALGTIINCKIEARDKGVFPGTLSSTTLFDVVYLETPPTPPPATPDPNTPDPNDNNNNNNNNNNNVNNANNNNNGNGNTNGTTAASTEENFINSPAAIAILSILGALLLGLAIFACCRFCCGNCGGSGGCCNGGGNSGSYGSRPASTSQINVSEGKYNSVRPTPVVHP